MTSDISGNISCRSVFPLTHTTQLFFNNCWSKICTMRQVHFFDLASRDRVYPHHVVSNGHFEAQLLLARAWKSNMEFFVTDSALSEFLSALNGTTSCAQVPSRTTPIVPIVMDLRLNPLFLMLNWLTSHRSQFRLPRELRQTTPV